MTGRLKRAGVAGLCHVLRTYPRLPGRWRAVPYALRAVRSIGSDLPEITVTTAHGFRFRCNPGDWLGQHVYVTGSWEEGTTDLVPALLGDGAVAVDVGANVGYFTLLMARCVGKRGRVHAFEPMPGASARLRQHVEMNGFTNVVVHDEAVSDQPGVGRLFPGPPDHTSVASLQPRADAVGLDVRCTALDEEFGTERVQLLKIDSEGFEPQVIAGARRLMARGVPYVIAEVSDSAWPATLMAAGFRMYRISWDGIRRVDRPDDPGLPTQYNALFASVPLPAALTSLLRESPKPF